MRPKCVPHGSNQRFSEIQDTIQQQNASPPANQQNLVASPVTCFIPEKYNFYPQLWFCPVPFIPVYKAFLPGQDPTKIREMLNSEFYHPCNEPVLPLLGNLTFLLHSSDNSDIIVDLNIFFISFLSPGDSFCREQVLLLLHQHHSPTELQAKLGWAVHPLIMLMLSCGRFLFKIF